MSSIRHGAGKYHSGLRRTISSEYMMHGRKRPIHLLAVTNEMGGPVQRLTQKFEPGSKQVQRQEPGQELGDIMGMLTKQSLAEKPSLLIELSDENGFVPGFVLNAFV